MAELINGEIASNGIIIRVNNPQLKMNVYASAPMPVYGVDYMTPDDYENIISIVSKYFGYQDLREIEVDAIFDPSIAVPKLDSAILDLAILG